VKLNLPECPAELNSEWMNATSIDNKGVIRECPACGKRNRVQFSSLGNIVRCGGCKAELPRLDSPIEIAEEADFESLIGSSSLPVLVDFWADWCGPCKMMSPEVNRLAATNSAKFVIAKVNTEGLPMLAQRFQINALPTLVLFAGQKELARTQGAQPAIQIQHFVEKTIRIA
jgi:thioredoxin 2